MPYGPVGEPALFSGAGAFVVDRSSTAGSNGVALMDGPEHYRAAAPD
jgi:hypothetical protein